MPADGHTPPNETLGPQATKLAAAGWVLIDGAWYNPARPNGVGVLADRPDPFTAEEWADYDSGRPERCAPELQQRAAYSAWRGERDGR